MRFADANSFVVRPDPGRSQGQSALPDAVVPAAVTSRDGAAGSSGSSPIRTTGLRRSPLTGGVNNASEQFDLPSPAVAVRNLVCAASCESFGAGLALELPVYLAHKMRFAFCTSHRPCFMRYSRNPQIVLRFSFHNCLLPSELVELTCDSWRPSWHVPHSTH